MAVAHRHTEASARARPPGPLPDRTRVRGDRPRRNGPGGEVLGILDTVIVAGNTSTETYVILNEMTLRPGSAVTPEAIQYDRGRIYSLGLFTKVEIYYDSLQSVRFLYVEVSERWHLIPVPIFGFRDGDPKKIYFGAGILHNNLRGRNQKLFAFLTLGYDPSAAISYSDPLFDHEDRLALSIGLSYARVRNRSEIYAGDFPVNNYSANLGLSKRFSLFQSLGLSAGVRAVVAGEYQPGFTLNTGGKDIFITASLAYTYDSRDLYEYASRGQFAELYVARNGFGESEVGFFRLGGDLRLYTPLPLGITLLTRAVSTIVAGGNVPGYMNTYFGYGERIRGYYTTVFEGENLAGGTIELRIPIIRGQDLRCEQPRDPARLCLLAARPQPCALWRYGRHVVPWPKDRPGLPRLRAGRRARLSSPLQLRRAHQLRVE